MPYLIPAYLHQPPPQPRTPAHSSNTQTLTLTEKPRSTASSPPVTKNTSPTLSNSAQTASSTADMQASSSASASTPRTTNSPTSRRYTSSSRCWIPFSGTCASWIWCLIFTRCVLRRYRGVWEENEGCHADVGFRCMRYWMRCFLLGRFKRRVGRWCWGGCNIFTRRNDFGNWVAAVT